MVMVTLNVPSSSWPPPPPLCVHLFFSGFGDTERDGDRFDGSRRCGEPEDDEDRDAEEDDE
jgi:hypothetical protein